MLPREFTDEQTMFRDAYRKFLAAEIVPHMEQWREAGIVDREAFRKAGEKGFLMIWPDEKYGGTGANIAYNLCRLGIDPILLATVGPDLGEHTDELRAKIDLDRYVTEDVGLPTLADIGSGWGGRRDQGPAGEDLGVRRDAGG